MITNNNTKVLCQISSDTKTVLICDRLNKQTLAGVTVKNLVTGTYFTSDANGIVRINNTLKHSLLLFSHVGYSDIKIEFYKLTDTILINKQTLRLNDITVSAKEVYGLQSATVIGTEAGKHIQPSNLNDLLQLLPGNLTQNNSFRNFLSPVIREIDHNPYSSIGTSVIIDGIQQTTFANMQTLTTASGYGSENLPFDQGMDFRTISVGNINKVEVIKGIASVSDGNATNAIIKVTTDIFESKSRINLKYNPGHYQVSFSNGNRLDQNKRLGFHGEYINSLNDARTPTLYYNLYKLESAYKYFSKSGQTFTSKVSIQGTRNNQFTSRNFLSNDEYYSEKDHNIQWLNRYVRYDINNFIKKLDIKINANYKNQNILRGFYTSSDVIPYTYSTKEGLHKGVFLPSNRLSEYRISASPLTINLKGELFLKHQIFKSKMNTLLGLESNLSKNFGRGVALNKQAPAILQDVIIRDQNFSEIPALLINSLYAEETFQKEFLDFQIGARIGYRHTFYNSHGSIKNFAEPRAVFNVIYSITPTNSISINAGIGAQQQVPIMKQIYPDNAWFDYTSANSYNSQNPELNYLYFTSYKQSTVNESLKPAKSTKREIGISYESNLFGLSLIYFNENHSNSIRFQQHYVANTYPIYNLSQGYDPKLSPLEQNLPHTNYSSYNLFLKPLNVGSTNKNGIEWNLSTAKIKPIKTSINVSGAWFKSIYYRFDGTNYYIPPIKNFDDILFMARYDSKDGKSSERITSKFSTITHIPQLGMVFSFTLQSTFKYQYQFIRETSIPLELIDLQENRIPFQEWMVSDPEYQIYVRTPNTHNRVEEVFPLHSQVNFQLTKEIGENIRISFLANNMFNYRPIYNYKISGTSVRLNTPLYFSLNLKLVL